MSNDKKYNIDDFWPEAEELLNQHFDDKKGGNKSAYWIISLLLIIAITGSTFLYLNLNESKLTTEKQSEKSDINNNDINKDNLTEEKNIKKYNQQENTSINKKSISEKNNSQKIEANNNISANNNDNLKTNNQENQSKSQIKLPQQKSTLKPSNELNSDQSFIPDSESKNALNIPASTDKTELLKNKESNNSTEIENSIIPNNIATENSITTTNLISSIQAASQPEINEFDKSKIEPIIIKDNSVESQIAQVAPIYRPEASVEETLQDKKDSVSINQVNQSAPIELTTKLEIKNDSNKNKKRITFGIFGAAGMFNTSNTLAVNQGFEAYKARRESEESSNLNTSFSLGFQVKFNKLILKSGVELNKYGETIKYSDWLNANQIGVIPNWNQFTDSVSFINYSYYQGNEYQGNETTYFQDSLQYFDTLTTMQKTFTDLSAFRGRNTISYFEIPLSLTYILFQKSHFNLGISLGGSVGFLSQKSGFYLDESMQNTIDLKSSSIIRKTVFNGRLGLQASYSFNPHSALFIEPQYRMSMQSVLNTPAGITQKYRSIGINLGYTYSF